MFLFLKQASLEACSCIRILYQGLAMALWCHLLQLFMAIVFASLKHLETLSCTCLQTILALWD